MENRANTARTWVSRGCCWAGALLFSIWLLPNVYGMLIARMEISRFQADHAETTSWAPGRVQAYRRALRVALPAPEAMLRIPSAAMEVPVMEGTSGVVLNRGAGHLAGTAALDASGNIVLAGHRDGFFRRLKNVALGDRIEIAKGDSTDVYRVDQLQVVERTDVSSLRPSRKRMLTLVTCYPFFYLGAAPQRYIVRASLVSSSASTF